MNNAEKQVLCLMRPRLVDELVVTESLLRAFCVGHVLDKQMARLLKTEANNATKASQLLDLLPSRGSRVFTAMLEIIEVTNPWLAEKMKASLQEMKSKDAKLKNNPQRESDRQCKLPTAEPPAEGRESCKRSSLPRLKEDDQGGAEKLLAEEPQKGRPGQQFTGLSNGCRQPHDLHVSKETETEMSILDFEELYEDLVVYLHGKDQVVAVDRQGNDFSFQQLYREVKEIERRARQQDTLLSSCIEKFDDMDKYATPLPVLIQRLLRRTKRLMKVGDEEKELLARVKEERDAARMHVGRLERQVDKLAQKLAEVETQQKTRFIQRNSRTYRSSTLAQQRGLSSTADNRKRTNSGKKAASLGKNTNNNKAVPINCFSNDAISNVNSNHKKNELNLNTDRRHSSGTGQIADRQFKR